MAYEKTGWPGTTRRQSMKCPAHKHEITLWLNCEQFGKLCEASQYVGCGNDLERYIIGILADNC